jgi:HlyD family secretion protein
MSQMDRVLEKPRGPSLRTIALAAVVLAVVALAWLLMVQMGESRLRIDPTRLTTAEVSFGEFREYYPSDGRVEPLTTVFLDLEQGGRVDEILNDGGGPIEAGDLIMRLSNSSLQRSSIEAETRLIENLNALRNTQINLAQNALTLRSQLLDIEHQILDVENRNRRYERLMQSDAIAREAYETSRDELAWLHDKRDLLIERIAREEELSRLQLDQADRSIERTNLSLDLLARSIESLEVRAPISGFLSSISAEIGQNIPSGQRVGQIDVLDAYKITVSIDQYYASRVEVGTPGHFELDGLRYDVAVERIFPEIVNDSFRVDVTFAGDVPSTLRRGQRLTVELSFSEPTESLTVARGSSTQQTSGRWAYLIDEDREGARRVPIRLGRQNPGYVEVLEGLREGDWIITSSYEGFNEVDELRFTQPIELLD